MPKRTVDIVNNIVTNEMSCIISSEDQVETTKYNIKKSIHVRVLMCGDMAYFAAVLGKVNMSGKWCTWCKLAPSEWKMCNHVIGDPWTISDMVEVREQVDSRAISDKPANRRGVVKKILIDSIPIDHIIFSLLHAEIGVGNKVLDFF